MPRKPVALPAWIYVGPLIQKLRLLDSFTAEAGNVEGCFQGDRSVIGLRGDMDPQQTVVTLFHEIFHAVSRVWCLDLTERQVDSLAFACLGLIRDNPDLCDSVAGLLGSGDDDE